jgi:hypothetical protein
MLPDSEEQFRKGKKYLNKDNLGKAAKAFERAYKADTENPNYKRSSPEPYSTLTSGRSTLRRATKRGPLRSLKRGSGTTRKATN